MTYSMLRHGAPYLLITGLSAGLLTACNDSSSGSSNSGDTGSASFSVTDAPVDDIDSVKITFNRIDLKHSNGDVESFEFDEPVVVENLLELTGNAAAPLVTDIEVAAGDYDWIRIFVQGGFPDSTVQPKLGNEADLFIPGQQNGNNNGNPRFLQLVSGFTVAAGGEADFTIDFVLRKGLTKPANGDHYLLRPAMRLLNNVEVGTIAGTVDNAVVASPLCLNIDGEPMGRTVYLYEGDLNSEELNPDDIYDPGIEEGSDEVEDADGVRPITTAEVSQDTDTGELVFEIGFVREIPEGYSLAFSCESEQDDPASDDDISFTEVIHTQVTAGETSNVEFTQVPVLEAETETEAEAETGA